MLTLSSGPWSLDTDRSFLVFPGGARWWQALLELMKSCIRIFGQAAQRDKRCEGSRLAVCLEEEMHVLASRYEQNF